MTRKELSFLIALFLFLIILLCSACGPAYHLKRADRHIQKAIDKGASIKKDTIRFHFRSPEIKFSTTLRPTWEKHSLSKDTLKYTDPKTGSTIKTKITLKDDCPEECIETVYQEVNCPPQEQVVDVPCETVQAGYTKWELWGTVFVAAIVFTAVGMFIQGMRR